MATKQYQLQRDWVDYMIKVVFKNVDGDLIFDKIVWCLSWQTVLKYVFDAFYNTLVRESQMDSFEEQHGDYRNELVELSKIHLPDHGTEERIKLCKRVMCIYWLMNN